MPDETKPRIAILCWEAGHVPRGLMQLESLVGNSTNLDTYPFPVRICRIEGANVETVLENPSKVILGRMIDESKKLIGEGIRAITTSCGFNAIFQNELTATLSVPVFTSSLLQVPFVHKILSPGKRIAVITAKKAALREEHMRAAGIAPGISVDVYGMENSPEWNKIFTDPEGDIDLELVSKEVQETARAAIAERPDTGAIVLECTDLPPFAAALRETTNLPVFDFQTMMGYVARSVGATTNF